MNIQQTKIMSPAIVCFIALAMTPLGLAQTTTPSGSASIGSKQANMSGSGSTNSYETTLNNQQPSSDKATVRVKSVNHSDVKDRQTYLQQHPMVKGAAIGAGTGAAVGGLTGVISHRGLGRGAAVGAGTGAGIGVVASSRTMKRHPIARDAATGAMIGAGVGMATGRHGRGIGRDAGIGAAIGLGVGLFENRR